MSAKAVVIDRSTLAVLYSHALLTDAEEIMGMLIGRKDVLKGIVYVDSALPLTRNDKRPDRVEIDPLQMHNACVPVVDAANKRRAVDKTVQQHPAGTSNLSETCVVGWYHSHPNITVFPSHVDVRTNEQTELTDPLWIGIIIGVHDKHDRNRVIAFQSNNENKNAQQSNEDDDLKFMRALEQCRSKAEEELVEKAHHGLLIAYVIRNLCARVDALAVKRMASSERRKSNTDYYRLLPLNIRAKSYMSGESMQSLARIGLNIVDELEAVFANDGCAGDGHDNALVSIQCVRAESYRCVHVCNVIEHVLAPTQHAAESAVVQPPLQVSMRRPFHSASTASSSACTYKSCMKQKLAQNRVQRMLEANKEKPLMRIILPSTEFSSLTHKEQGIIGNQNVSPPPASSSSFTPDVLYSDVHRSGSTLDTSTARSSVGNVRAMSTSDAHVSSSYDQSFASATTDIYSTPTVMMTSSVGGGDNEKVSNEVNNNNTATVSSAPPPQTRFSYAAAACRPPGGKVAPTVTNGEAPAASPSNELVPTPVSTTPTLADIEVTQKKLTQAQRKQQQKQQKDGGKHKHRR